MLLELAFYFSYLYKWNPAGKSKKAETTPSEEDESKLKYSNIKDGQPPASDSPKEDPARFLKKK